MALTLTSAAFLDGGEIPRRFTCDGGDLSPALNWSGLPEGTRSLVLIVDDPDSPSPSAPKTVWDHWLIYNLPPDCPGLPEGVHAEDRPLGVRDGVNSWGEIGYRGPCPPVGRHRYFHILYALDLMLEDLDRPTKNHLLVAMEDHILAHAELVGTYEKGD